MRILQSMLGEGTIENYFRRETTSFASVARLRDHGYGHHQLLRSPFAELVVVRLDPKAAPIFSKSAVVWAVPLRAAVDYNPLYLIDKPRKGEINDERQESRSESAKYPQEHRAQDNRGKDRCPPQRRKARPPCGRDSSPGRRRRCPEEVGRAAEGRTATRGGTGKHVRRPDHLCPLETAPPGPGGSWHIHLQILWYPLRLPRDGGNAGS